MTNHINELQVWIPGDPQPQGSKRAWVVPGTNRARLAEDCTKSRPWRDSVVYGLASEWAGQPALTGPVRVALCFHMRRPGYHYRKVKDYRRGDVQLVMLKADAPSCHAVKPDADKLARCILDALTISGVIRDDSQVSTLIAEKIYAEATVGVGCQCNVEAI